MVYALIGIAIGVAGLAFLFASQRPGLARKIWTPGNQAFTAFRYGIALLTLYVLLTAGGIAFWLGLAGAAFAGIHLYFTKKGESGDGSMPAVLRPFAAVWRSISGMLFGTRR